MPGRGCRGDQGVPHVRRPPVEVLGQVAAFAATVAVGHIGATAFAGGQGVVGVPDRRIAPGSPADLVPAGEENACDVGKVAATGIDLLIGVRGLGEELVSGATTVDARFAADSEAAGEMLAGIVKKGDVILVKGSRGVRTEKVIDKLLEKFHAEEKA